ncbi:MAG: cupin domain-containing protein [Thermoplasmata archaeon]
MTPPQGGKYVPDTEGTAMWFLGQLFDIKLDGEKIGGPSLVQVTLPPGPTLGAPPHVHDCDETAYVLEGTVRYHFGEETQDAGPGSVLFFPEGMEEWFENTTDQQAKVLMIYSGGRMASFFREAGEPAETRTLPPPLEEEPDLEALAAVASKYGVEIRAPPS